MSYRAIFFDIDGVFFKDVNFWMKVHEAFGTLDEGKILTEKYLRTDYEKLVEEVVVKLWKGRDATPYFNLVNSLEYLPGVSQVFDYVKKKGYITALISASSLDVARRIQKDYGVDHLFANHLVIRDNKVVGEFEWPVAEGSQEKAKIVLDLCNDLSIDPQEVIYVGDSKKDLLAFLEVGKSIAFNSSCEELKKAATHVVNSEDLSDILEYLPK